MSNLTQEQKRIKIAEACGWTKTEYPSPLKAAGEVICAWTHPIHKPVDDDMGYDPWYAMIILPDYFNDLNAMHEAEDAFPHPSDFYRHTLAEICGGEHRIYRATAAQRAEAFGKTLNLW